MEDKPTGRRRPAPTRPTVSTYYRSGASSPNVQSPFSSARPQNTKLQRFWIKSADIILVLGLIFLLIYSLMVSSKVKVITNDTSYHSLTNYQDSAKRYLKSVKNKNKVTFDSQGLIEGMRQDYPEISTASVELPVFSQKPVVRLNIAAPSFYLKSGQQNYIIDANGRAVALSSQYPSIKGLAQIVDQSGYSINKGKQVLSEHDVSFIKNLQKHCAASGIEVKSLILPARPQEFDLATTDQAYVVKFYLGGDPDIQIGQFLAARHNFSQSKIVPNQYLDVRVSGKIFYK